LKKTAFVVHSTSADIDIPVILLWNDLSEDEAYIDSGTRKHRKIINLSLSSLTDLQKKALHGMHPFTDGVLSSFFIKEKQMCWNAIKKNSSYLRAVSHIDYASRIPETLMAELEKYACHICEEKSKSLVNKARSSIFLKQIE